MARCKLCNKRFGVVTNTHLLAQHGMAVREYASRFGYKGVGFARQIFDLPKKDPRYIAWRKNLLRRPPPWSKGYTKETHPGLAKLVQTFRDKKIDNFAKWRERARKLGIIPRSYPPLRHNSDTAFLIGLVLGDGHLGKFPRTEALDIALGTDKPLLWQYAARIVQRVFHKKPMVWKRSTAACMLIRIYQKDLSKRLGVPLGNRGKVIVTVPEWILKSRKFYIAYLKGLFEAEGSFSIHLPTCTYNFQFSNRNPHLLKVVEDMLRSLGFHPEVRPIAVRLRKRQEALAFEQLINFRKYP